jgi:hypothetical protein
MDKDLFLPLLSKQGITVIRLASLFLTHQCGDRIEPVQHYAAKFDIGVGTVQASIAYLQEIGAVELDSRGHLGTFIRKINYPLVWSVTGQNQIIGGMPLPYSKRYEGLATGLHEAFERAGIALNLVYTRGALNRLQALARSRFDFVVLSRFALNYAVEHNLAIEEVLGLGSESYVGQHMILLRDSDKDQIEPGMRVGLDSSSIDQTVLTKLVCGDKNVEFIEINYMNLMAAMEKGRIDATVWNGDDFPASTFPCKAVPLPARESIALTGDNTEAVIAVDKGNQLVLRTLRSIIDKELVRDIQAKVMGNILMPSY